ncbi:MAG TPA: histidine--tRNA ligase [Candidatus Pacearchaeota archaeon]|nr:histidine--tRNA ligase [Candidatus Pacearchaeota archaeon]
MTKIRYQTVTGMHDVFGREQVFYEKVEDTAKKIAEFYAFQKITTPILEDQELFIRSVGETTDIVEKEMFTLKTKGKDLLVLRPEGTASVFRAYLENGMQSLSQPVKLWYYGPFFRYERPQAGRYRQFWQIGFEILGDASPVLDAEAILIAHNLLSDLGFKKTIVNINSIGCEECRKDYKKALSSFLKNKKNLICGDCKRRAEKNILRVLDCKNPKCQQILSEAPQVVDYLCPDCKNHFKQVLEFLDEISIPYRLDPFLVRGLDYYSKTVFEIGFEESPEEEAIGSLLGGGRYDLLGKALKTDVIPAVGFSMGVERLIALMKLKKIELKTKKKDGIFIVQVGDLAKRKALKIMDELRKAKINVYEAISKDSMKLQLTKANKLAINIVLIIGQKEALDNTVIIKDMKTGKQSEVKQENIVKEIKKRFK